MSDAIKLAREACEALNSAGIFEIGARRMAAKDYLLLARRELFAAVDELEALREWRDRAVASCAKRRCSERDAEIDVLRRINDGLLEAEKDMKARVAQLERGYDVLRTALRRLEKERDSLRGRVAELERENNRLRAAIAPHSPSHDTLARSIQPGTLTNDRSGRENQTGAGSGDGSD